jgi:membrane-bound serine protease (ClpP class)
MHAWLAFVSGVLTVIGIVLLVAAFSGITYYGIGAQLMIITAIVLLSIAALAAWMLYAAIRAQYIKVKTGKEALIGAKGVAVTDLKPNGEIRVLGEFWQATAKDGAVAKKQEVEVIGMDGMFLVVRVAEEKLNSSNH